MAQPLLHQRPCRVSQGRYAVRGCRILLLPSLGLCGRATSRPACVATQLEEESCTTCSHDSQFGPEERSPATLNAAGAPSCSGSSTLGSRSAIFTVATGLSLLVADAASANGGTLSGGALDLFMNFLVSRRFGLAHVTDPTQLLRQALAAWLVSRVASAKPAMNYL
jgi:hypothetical protein